MGSGYYQAGYQASCQECSQDLFLSLLSCHAWSLAGGGFKVHLFGLGQIPQTFHDLPQFTWVPKATQDMSNRYEPEYESADENVQFLI